MLRLEDIKTDPEKTVISNANLHLGVIGYTDHSFRHLEIVGAKRAREILGALRYPAHLPNLLHCRLSA